MYIIKYIKTYTDVYTNGVFMQIGKLKDENVKLLEQHEEYGFGNKTKMLDYAMDLLRVRVKKEKRRAEKEEMLGLYAKSSFENYFADIDGDDFE